MRATVAILAVLLLCGCGTTNGEVSQLSPRPLPATFTAFALTPSPTNDPAHPRQPTYPPTLTSAPGTTPPAAPEGPTVPSTLDQPGSPAIVPTQPNNDPAVPAFTEADVRAYVATHPHPDQVPDASPATIVRVEFLPARMVEQRIGDTGMSPDMLLCLVTLKGTFHVAGPYGSRGVSGTTGTLLYNAHTGNHIEETVGP